MPFLIDAHHVGAQQTGNETWIRNISRELSHAESSENLVFAATGEGEARVRAITGRDPVELSSSTLTRLGVDLPRLVHRTHADALLLQYTMPLRVSAPCVVMIHDTSFEDPSAAQWMRRRTAMRIRLSARASARRAARLLAPSQFTKDCLVKLYDVAPDEVVLSPNAVDPELAAHLDKGQRAVSRVGFRVLAVGNVLPRKNLTTLALAIAELRTQVRDVSLRVVGQVPGSSRHIEEELRQLLGDAVSFSGYVDDAQLAVEYQSADVLAFPSLFEGFGIPVIEAMYAGTPVVASDSTSLPEIVGGAGVCVPATDVRAWAVALRRIHDEPAWATELSARGRVRAADYQWRASAEAVLKTLYDVSGRSRSGA